MEPVTPIDESLRKLVKARVSAVAVQFFGNEITYLVSDSKKRMLLYDELALQYNDDENTFDDKVHHTIFVFLPHSFAITYETAKLWSSHFLRSYNISVSPAQIMRAYKNKETYLYSEHTTEEQVVEALANVGFDVYDLEKAKEKFTLPDSGLNGNFSAPLAEKPSPAFSGYDVLADILPSGNPEDNKYYGMISGICPTFVGLYFFLK